jgi:hypothetical protein
VAASTALVASSSTRHDGWPRRPRQRHELALAGRQVLAPLAHPGRHPVGQRAEPAVEAELGEGQPHLVVGGVRRPKRTLSMMVVSNRKASWGTITIVERSDAIDTSRRSCPAMRTAPSWGRPGG